MNYFKKLEQQNERGYSVEEALQDALKRDYDEVIIIGKNENNVIEVTSSLSSEIYGLGMLKIGEGVLLGAEYIDDLGDKDEY